MAWSIFKQGGGDQVAVGWATQFLQKIGAPVTPGNIQFVYQWEKSEGGGGKYNPLNQGVVEGHPNLTTSGTQFGGGAADYASWDAGLQGAYDYLHYAHYAKVLSNLKANNPAAARAALWASPWAAGHYGYGSNWFYGTIPGGTPVLPDKAPGSANSSAGADTPVDSQFAVFADSCAWNFSLPSVSTPSKAFGVVPLPSFSVGGQQFCLLSKTQVRQMIAIGLFIGAGAVVLVGSLVLVQIAGLKAASSLPVVGGATKKVTGLSKTKAPAAKSATYDKSEFTGGKHRTEDKYGKHAA